jgi:hypothetical protein
MKRFNLSNMVRHQVNTAYSNYLEPGEFYSTLIFMHSQEAIFFTISRKIVQGMTGEDIEDFKL